MINTVCSCVSLSRKISLFVPFLFKLLVEKSFFLFHSVCYISPSFSVVLSSVLALLSILSVPVSLSGKKHTLICLFHSFHGIYWRNFRILFLFLCLTNTSICSPTAFSKKNVLELGFHVSFSIRSCFLFVTSPPLCEFFSLCCIDTVINRSVPVSLSGKTHVNLFVALLFKYWRNFIEHFLCVRFFLFV